MVKRQLNHALALYEKKIPSLSMLAQNNPVCSVDAAKFSVSPDDSGDFASVCNPDTGEIRKVYYSFDELTCDCCEFLEQKQLGKQPAMCVHGYATLLFMGYGCIDSYVAENQHDCNESDFRL